MCVYVICSKTHTKKVPGARLALLLTCCARTPLCPKVYTSVTAQAFYQFRCHPVTSTGADGRKITASYLVADYSIKCYDVQWNAMLVLVLAVLL